MAEPVSTGNRSCSIVSLRPQVYRLKWLSHAEPTHNRSFPFGVQILLCDSDTFVGLRSYEDTTLSHFFIGIIFVLCRSAICRPAAQNPPRRDGQRLRTLR